jgi:GT2 family glycosyltransferase
MQSLSVVILSKTLDDDIYKMNCNCLDSLFASEDWEDYSLQVFLIESNRENPYTYDDRVQVIIPEEPFNFHAYLNMGIKLSDTDFVALCNNDIVFSKGWYTEILKVKSGRKDFLCFSPIDRDYKTMSEELFPGNKDYYIGWDNKYHFAAWCFVLDRTIFKITGMLDETFNFYSADDDFLMTLRKYALKNVLVTKSHVKHLSQQVTQKIGKRQSFEIFNKEKYPIPEKYLKKGYDWLWDDVRFYEAFFKMEKKWGNPLTIKRLNRLFTHFPVLRKPFFTRIMYSKFVNVILSKFTGA